MSRSGRIAVASKGVSVVEGKKVANLFLSITGDTLPDGREDVDVQNEVTDFDAAASAAKRWMASGGRVKFDHIPGEAGFVGSAVKAFADPVAREVFGHVVVADPIIVRMVEREVPFEASWHGPYTETPTAEKAADGKPIVRVFPIEWDEVSLILPDFPGAARKRSKLIAAKSAAPIDDATKEGNNVEEVMKMMEGKTAEEKAALIVALFGALSPEEQAAMAKKLSPEKPSEPPAEPPVGEKAAAKLIDEKLAPVLAAVATLSAELKSGLELASAKIGEKAASGLDAAKFDAAILALGTRTETIENGVKGIRELMAKTPQTVIMPGIRDVGSKASEFFGEKSFATTDELVRFAEDLASSAPTQEERSRILSAKNRKIIEMNRAK